MNCDHVSTLIITSGPVESVPVNIQHGSSRLVLPQKEGAGVIAALKVLVLVCYVGDVLCPSGRAGFSPNPRAPRQGSPRLLITGPPAGSSTLLTSSAHKHTDPCHKKTSQHTHTTLGDKPQGAARDWFMGPTHSTNIFLGMCQYRAKSF